MSEPFFVYMLRCADGSYYVGHTDALERRVAQHQAGELPGYTHDRRPVTLVWSQETATREEALSAERQVKGWGRAKKEALIAGDWARVSALAKSRAGLRQAQPDRGGEPGLRQAQPERGGEAGLRQAQPERGGEAGLRQARPERGGEAGLRQAQPERGGEAGLRQAQPERGGSGFRPGQLDRGDSSPAHPELVEGSTATAPRPRQAQPDPGHSTPPDHPELVEGPEPFDAPDIAPILASQRRALAKAITLLESTRADHRARADELLNALLPHTGHAMRLGISGVPGVGKSTFIEALGLALIAKGHRVAVLAIDPSSSLSGGSILGDKTRMEQLSIQDAAYIRPSPASGTLGGVAEKTREAMLVCEAAGFDVVIVETVGVGQSETTVASMTDLFVLLQLPNAGDDLQAIKKGVMEIPDLIVINKADIDPAAATRAQAQIVGSLRLFAGHDSAPQVLLMSALQRDGFEAFWSAVESFHAQRRASGEFARRREKQSLAWMWDIVQARLQADFKQHAAVREALPQTLHDVTEARIAPSAAARRLLHLFER